MKKLLSIFFIVLLSITETFAYAIKVYDEFGNRVGTFRKEGDKYQFYDFNDNKVDTPEEIIKNVPTQKTLTEYTQIFYDENMIPIGTWRSGFYGNNGKYYPRLGEYYPASFYKMQTPYIVRPGVKINNSLNKIPSPNKTNTYIKDTRFPEFHY